ncbi:hypothetical protein QVD17_01404 [Tagetes erecta]|uniref:Uncharacterized protein n=1 Tax=Tagetes erecta TaxID=13708 RepID=A0AAD8L9P3_TARER|nr:hypothetical protein QVD17_01404 [Tagetes erecta]
MTHQEPTGKITPISRNIVRRSVVQPKISNFKEVLRVFWDGCVACSISKQVRYRRLSQRQSSLVELGYDQKYISTATATPNGLTDLEKKFRGSGKLDFLDLKIKYVGDEQENESLEMAGLNLMDKTMSFGGAKIVFSIWDVGGDRRSNDQVPIACKAVAEPA